ncbi:UNKNOWN [Stylonychia lemnae]|uniref:3CxxC-type domain-containing protein n=1 Tax=Stylonychia lemnae TaxID=5949 RepID=A0A078AAP4_STYLE|nr:UNKNOWN [Stylonychia lemnae]|eukprot:CDW77863.1 UNKNOWN [Stylonychia lemnae]
MVDISQMLFDRIKAELKEYEISVRIQKTSKLTSKFERGYKSKLKFYCDECYRNWNSAQGQVTINYYLDRGNQELEYNAETYRQQCSECKQYCEPELYFDEVKRLSEWFAKDVINILYGIKKTPTTKPKESNMNTPHQSELCEACKLGKCKVQKENNLEQLFGKMNLGTQKRNQNYGDRDFLVDFLSNLQ